jgi:hypothetical protein
MAEFRISTYALTVLLTLLAANPPSASAGDPDIKKETKKAVARIYADLKLESYPRIVQDIVRFKYSKVISDLAEKQVEMMFDETLYLGQVTSIQEFDRHLFKVLSAIKNHATNLRSSLLIYEGFSEVQIKAAARGLADGYATALQAGDTQRIYNIVEDLLLLTFAKRGPPLKLEYLTQLGENTSFLAVTATGIWGIILIGSIFGGDFESAFYMTKVMAGVAGSILLVGQGSRFGEDYVKEIRKNGRARLAWQTFNERLNLYSPSLAGRTKSAKNLLKDIDCDRLLTDGEPVVSQEN